uniref:ATP synthase F0 subunit 8 n=1 Tax=Polypedilum yongsanensis TaxID=1005982 RepID=UPI0023F2DEBD|nr:ATP synthase F0 subunit 8 [Polypedilum yongsanensis]WEF49694.1 ATP synthase F0 subunit 8 [Polypedilum yongsanensis]
MPQMSPMLWSVLFLYFILLFMIFNILNYFNFIPLLKSKVQPTSPNLNENTAQKISLTWKW